MGSVAGGGGAWASGPAAWAPPQWRALGFGAAFSFTAGMAAIRVMAGAHFVSDAVFAGVFTFLIVWLIYGLVYRWPRTRLTDAQVDRAIARFSRATAAVRAIPMPLAASAADLIAIMTPSHDNPFFKAEAEGAARLLPVVEVPLLGAGGLGYLSEQLKRCSSEGVWR